MQADSLVAAYVIDSLDGEERCSLATHLAECRRHDGEFAAFRGVAARLPSAIDPVAPPPALKGRLLAGFDAEAAARSLPESDERASVRAPARPSRLRSPALAYGLAAALAVVAIALGAIALSRGDEPEGITRTSVSEGGASLSVVYVRDSQAALVNVDLPLLGGGQAYQAWALPAQGAPRSIGILSTNQGTNLFSVDLSNAARLAISIEPAGGSAQPTTTPILVAEL
jgi:anti-sigma-K factor RskA